MFLFDGKSDVDVAFLGGGHLERLVGRKLIEEPQTLDRLIARDDSLFPIDVAGQQEQALADDALVCVRVTRDLYQLNVCPVLFVDTPRQSDTGIPVVALG